MIKERKRNRLQGCDYSQDNLYFITSCVHDRICCFGEIVMAGRDLSPSMVLNKYGQIANDQWNWLGKQYPYVLLHEFVVMPNHIHGIIEINRSNMIPTIKIKSLSELMGAYKTTTSKQIHLAGYPAFGWQRSFHDHIIRDDKSFETISEYIQNNPSSWDKDKFYNQ